MRRFALLMTVVVVTFLIGQSAAQKRRPKTIKRAKPPAFKSTDTDGIFFKDVFSDGGLVGSRPTNLSAAPVNVAVGQTGGSGTDGSGSGGGHAWKDIISSDAIEDEIKRIGMSLDKNITTPTKFAGGGYKKARQDFSMLAMLFAITAEYDDEIRWKKNAPELRDLFARAAGGSKVGSQQAYDQAKKTRDMLKDLVRGSFTSVKAGEIKTNWEMVGQRVPFMSRLEKSLSEKMKPWVANAGEFKANKDSLVHEASIFAAIGEVLTLEGMEEAEEDDYTVHAKTMKKAARDIIDSVELDNYDNAVKAVGVIGQSCSRCHEDWR